MCKLVVSVKEESKDYPELDVLMDLQIADLKTQKDGCGAIAINQDGTFEIKRSLDDYDSVFEWLDKKRKTCKLFSVHTRIRSSGGVNEKNVHFFEDRGCFIAHNGWLTGYHPSTSPTLGFKSNSETDKLFKECEKSYDVLEKCKSCFWYNHRKTRTCKKHICEENRILKLVGQIEGIVDGEENYQSNYGGYNGYPDLVNGKEYGSMWKEEVDSLTFLKAIERPILKESIEKAVRVTNFSGMAFIYDSIDKRAWVVIKSKKVPMAIREGFATLFSFPPTLGGSESKEETIFGIPVESKSEYEIMPSNELVDIKDGVFEIDFGLTKKSRV